MDSVPEMTLHKDSYGSDLNLEFHDTPQLWVAYRGCGCAECPKGFGKSQEEAVADLEDRE